MIKRIMTEPEYRQLNYLSYSQLAGVDKTPASLVNKQRLESPGITFGSAVDTYMFDGKEEFKKKFTVLSSKPSGKIPDVIDDVFILAKNKETDFTPISRNIEDYKQEILDTAKAMKFGQTWNEDTLLSKVYTEEAKNYFVSLIDSSDKLVIDLVTYERVINTCNVLSTHPFTVNKFTPENKNIEIVYQFPIVWKVERWNKPSYKAKSLLDVLKIDHKNKIIYPIDLKTSSDHILSFENNYFKFRYPIQEAFYTDAITYWKNNIETKFKDYKVAPFEFVIIQNTDFAKPLIYRSTTDSYELGKFGGNYKGKYVKGYLQLIDEKNWHLENQLFDYPKQIYDNNGVVLLGLQGLV